MQLELWFKHLLIKTVYVKYAYRLSGSVKLRQFLVSMLKLCSFREQQNRIVSAISFFCTLYGNMHANSQSRLFLLIQQSAISENRKVYGLMPLFYIVKVISKPSLKLIAQFIHKLWLHRDLLVLLRL